MSHKPRSMPVGQRNILRPNDSASLWNCTLSPGWTREESDILRKALMRFGVGNWKDIMESGSLPGKTNAQLNLQTQRLLGQQSTAEFQMLHIDPLVIGGKNAQIQGEHVKRKNGFIVNSGGKLSREEKLRRIKENKEKYELPEDVWSKIDLPRLDDPVIVLEQKERQLAEMQQELIKVREWIQDRRTEVTKDAKALSLELDSFVENDENLDIMEETSRGKRIKRSP
ncbi:hypothetical protein SpCBS45565_g03506 [Spizellomyces sp. 'palustris']|nr:hypothetical protein SpCBS45565_g03506 [Spizellomyces sp. 'palustris']